MREHYDFPNAIKNPYADRLKNGYTIIVERKDHDEVTSITKSKRQKKNESKESSSQ